MRLDDGLETGDQLRRQNTVIADFGLAALRSNNLDELLEQAAQLISTALEVTYVKILELLPERKELLVRAGVNWKPSVVGYATIGADTNSAGGYALRTNEPVVSQDLSTETRFRIPRLLIDHGIRSMVNVIIVGDDGPFGVLEVDSRQPRQFDADDVAFLRNYANLIAAAIDRMRSQEALARAANQNELLMKELRHRVKNTLTLASSLVSQTRIEGRTAEEYREALFGRLQALARAEDLLFDIQADRVELADLAERVLEPYRTSQPDAVLIEGSHLAMPVAKARMLGLVLHELATNAAKYGALSHPGGRVLISWSVRPHSSSQVHLVWQERGGPVVNHPQSSGFGKLMIEQMCPLELGGKVHLTYPPEGVTCEISFPTE